MSDDPIITEVEVRTFPLGAGCVLVVAYADVEDGSGLGARLTAQSQLLERDAKGLKARLYERETSFALSVYAEAAGRDLVLATGVLAKYRPPALPPTPEEILVRELGEEDAARALAVLTDAGFWITERDWADEED